MDIVATNCSMGVCSHMGCLDRKCSDIIGVEVKLRGRFSKQIRDYLESRVLTEVCLATGTPSPDAKPHITRYGRRANPDICALVFINHDFTSLTVYSFCDLCCQKKTIGLGGYYGDFRYGSYKDRETLLREILVNHNIIPQDCIGNCKVLFVNRSRKGMSCYANVIQF